MSWRHLLIKINLCRSLKTIAEGIAVELAKEAINGLKNREILGVNGVVFAGGTLAL